MSRRPRGAAPPSAAAPPELMEAVRAHQAGRLDEAEARYRRILSQAPRQRDALHLLGVIAHQRGDHARAVSLIDRAIAVDGRDPAFHNNRGTALLALGRHGAAEAAFRRALELNPAYAEAHNNLGNALQEQGHPEAAIGCYGAALAARPNYPEALSNLGRAQRALGDLAAAEASFRAAVSLRPDYAQAMKNLGDAVAERGRPEEAAEHYLAASRANPKDAEPRAAQAALLERASDLEAALAEAEAALSLEPANVRASLVAARSERRLGRLQEGLARLDALAHDVLDAEARAFVAFEQATFCDRLGDYRRAARCFADANRLLLDSPLGRGVDRSALPRQIAALTERFTADWLRTWSAPVPAPVPGPVPEAVSPVFLVGFPRSGTTLLDQVLDAHPRLATIEEKPLVDTVKQALVERFGAYPEGLARLTEADVEGLRADYMAAVDRLLPRRGAALVIDKMPLNIIDIGLIWRLYPDARILLALRHPCDVVLSGFMQAFRPNEAMVHFGAIDTTARLYASVMDLWLRYRAVLPIATASVRYEDLVVDFEAETRRLLDFLGVGWDDAVRGYRDHARTRTISTPSYHQVVQPLYTRSIGRWKNYRPELEAALPLLRPYVEAFGYNAADL